MPGMDKQGPEQKGPGSGRALGYCRTNQEEQGLMGTGMGMRRHSGGGKGKGKRLKYNLPNNKQHEI